MRVLIRIVGSALILSGCQEYQGTSHVTTRDSAGIQIVETSAPLWGDSAHWTVNASPLLDLVNTGSGPSHEFFRVRDVIRLPDSRLVVADGGSSQVRFYSSQGNFIRAAGGPGGGPGEFRRLETLSRYRGDSIAVFDSGLCRVTVLDKTAETFRTIVLSGLKGRCLRLRSIHDSAFVGFSYSPGSQGTQPGRFRMPYAVVHFGPTGRVLDTVEIIQGNEGQQNAVASASVPFGKDGHLAVRGVDLILGSAEALQFDVYRQARSLHQRVRVPGIEYPVSPREVDSIRQSFRISGLPPGVRELVESIEFPELKPAYANLLTDSDGFVWAAEDHQTASPSGTVTWNVFSPTGEWLGFVQTPSRFRVFEIGADYLLGVWRDDLDVEHVQLLELNRT